MITDFPVLVPSFAKPLLRALTAWRRKEGVSVEGPARRLKDTAQCLAVRLNLSDSLSSEVAEESAVLEPLFRVYGKRLNGSQPSGTLLHMGYTNEQLFFVLWAQGHCGESDGSAVVNAVSKNSARLAKAFRCGKHKAMFLENRCHVEA
ncbi:hypothetical protein V5799_004690 [Amblyomma americanum]|uniref:Uncharacterized protein n=1 Tax=Amblyomma americanum TaxID=6943 RepID=A0AAQ4D5D6_AMBAM